MSKTIYDIAREANVGIGTVSRVFNNHPNVSEGTKARVLTIAKKFNYSPNRSARSLARKRTNCALALFPFYPTYFFLELLQGVQERLSVRDFDLLLAGVEKSEQLDSILERNARRDRIDGAISFSMRLTRSVVNHFISSKIPLVLVDANHAKFDSISVDNVQGARHAIGYLLSQGHHRVALICANTVSQPARERYEGYLEAMKEANIPLRRDLIRISAATELDGFTYESGYELMKKLLANKDKPTAVFVTSDIQAVGALKAMNERGIRCPNDIALIGFDDTMLAAHFGLTTMRQPMKEMGSKAVDLLLRRFENQSSAPEKISLVPELVIRETTS